MDWFAILLPTSALILFLWLSVGIYLDLKQRIPLAKTTASKPERQTGVSSLAPRDAWNNLTTSHVREAFDLFLQSQ
jgi:hypothetical protein